jgi:hypothetical protein
MVLLKNLYSPKIQLIMDKKLLKLVRKIMLKKATDKGKITFIYKLIKFFKKKFQEVNKLH